MNKEYSDISKINKEQYQRIKSTYNGLYDVWRSMRQRCYYEKHVAYRRYGGRGITVCREWRENFKTFYKWAKNKHKIGLTLDRRNNDGNYEPSNCRFITMLENRRNSPLTKLNIEKVKIIRSLLKEDKIKQGEIGKMFGVSGVAISNIKTKRRWVD